MKVNSFCRCKHHSVAFFDHANIICISTATPADNLCTPVASKISGHRLELSDSEGRIHTFCPLCFLQKLSTMFFCVTYLSCKIFFCVHTGDRSDAAGSSTTKRPSTSMRPSSECTKRARADFKPASSVYANICSWAKKIVCQTSEMYCDLPEGVSVAVFGHTTPALPKRKYVFHKSYTTNPWVRGAVPLPPQGSVGDQLQQVFSTASLEDLRRYVHAIMLMCQTCII
jgi:hypothetical protein